MLMHQKLSFSGPPTTVDKTKKLEGLWLPLPALLPVLCGVPPKLQQSRLVRVQPQAELPEPLPEGVQEPLSIIAVPEANDEIVQVAHDDHVATRYCPPPALDP